MVRVVRRISDRHDHTLPTTLLVSHLLPAIMAPPGILDSEAFSPLETFPPYIRCIPEVRISLELRGNGPAIDVPASMTI